MVLIGDFNNGVLTPVTTLAALLADAGVSAANSAAIQKAFGVAVVDVADQSSAYDPYEALAKDDANAFPQVIAHAQLSGLLLLASTLGKQSGLSPVASLQKLATAIASADLASLLAGGAAAEQRSALLAAVLPELTPSLNPTQRGVIGQVFNKVSAEFDALRSYAKQYSGAGLPTRALLPASNSLKATLISVFTESIPQVLSGAIDIDLLEKRFAAQLAGGALDTTALQADHLVSVTPFQQGRLRAGGSATFLVALGSAAPAHGLRLIYSLNAPDGTRFDTGAQSSSGAPANGFGEILIPAGLSSTTITIALPEQLTDSISQVSLNLRYSDSGFAIDPNAASAVYQIDGLQAPTLTGTLQPFGEPTLAADGITGGDAADLISGGWGDDSLDGGAGNDQLDGEGGMDLLTGGAGNDQLDGGSGNDFLFGDDGIDILAGGIGDDTVSGGAGNDILRGDAGDDRLSGDAGDDKLDGGSGNDLLDGGSGRNTLYGGSGADRFLLNAPSKEADLILDFNPLEGDQLVVLASRFPGATAADFAIIGGTVVFRGTPIALVANDGRSYGLIRDLTPYLLFTDTAEPKAQQPSSSPLAGTGTQSVNNSSLTMLPSSPAGQERTQISNDAQVLMAADALTNGLQLAKAGGSTATSSSGLILNGTASAPVMLDLSTLKADSLADSQVTLLLYRVNSSGVFLSPDGTTTAPNLEAAVIGSIGAVNDDGGRSLFNQGSSQVLLSSGQELRIALSRRNRPTVLAPELQISQTDGGLILALSTTGASTPDLLLRASIASATAATTELAIAQKAGLGDLLYLNNGESLNISLASSCRNTNTYAFVKVDLSIDASGGSVFSINDANGNAIPLANNDAFRAAIRSNLSPGFLVAQGGNRTTLHSWTVASGSGFYAPVMLSQNGDVFFIGSFNADGRQHIKPVGDGAFSFEDLSGANSDFDYNDGVLRIIRGDTATLASARSIVFGQANSGATYLSGGINFSALNKSQFIHSNRSGSNLISTGSANDTLVLYTNGDRGSLGAGKDRLHILSGSSNNNIDLGFDTDADRVYFYRPTAEQNLSSLLNFDPLVDTISLVNLDSTASSSFTITPTKATLLLDNKPMLELIGAFSTDSLKTALRRSDLGAGDAMAAIAERGLLVSEMIPDLLGTSQQSSDGQWYGYNVDIARAISEQLTGNADALAILPNKALVPGLNNIRDGYADLGLLGSTSTLNRDVNFGIDFSKPYLVDVQSFLVRGLKSAAELKDQTIGVITGSTAKGNALSFLNANGINASVTEYATSTDLADALRNGQIKAIASDRTRLMGYQATIAGSSLLEETFSNQPLAVALPENQSQLKDAVNWIVQAPAAATELGIGSGDLPDLLAQAERGGADLNAIAPQTRIFLELDPSTSDANSLGKALGLARGFTQKLLARLGNATEMWQRHFPTATNIEQNTASEAGQLRSLPFLGQGSTDALINNDNRGDLLALIRERGTLQVATGGTAANIGFSAPDTNGTLQGVDVDIAKALAIAIFGDASKLNFVTTDSEGNPLSFSSTFAKVANGEVDVALRAATDNLWRDSSFGVDFSDPYLATGLKVLCRSTLGISRIDQLNGSTIGVISDTTAAQNLNLALSKTGESARILTHTSNTELYDAFRSGAIEAIALDGALLAGFQQQLTNDSSPIATTLLNGQLSYEPIAAVVDENQSKLLDMVNAVIGILRQAAALGVTSDNVNQKLIKANVDTDPSALRELFQLNSSTALTGIGITAQRVTELIAAVGNMDQIVARWIVNPDQNVLPRDRQLQRPL